MGDQAGACFPATAPSTAAPAFAPPPQGSQYLVVPLDQVQAGAAIWSYYQLYAPDPAAAFGLRFEGTGVAPFDPDAGQFVPTGNLLWSGDGPSFGLSAVVDGADAYAYACASDANGNPVCYGAHALASALDDPAAYTYARGAGFYTSDFAQALPILDGPGSLSVRRHGSGRWLATYVPPLGSVVKVRSALGPMGPFSNERDLFTCQLGPGDFCSGGNQHPEDDPDGGVVAISYVPANLSPPAAGAGYWPRLVLAPLPASLP
jgi:hypothetical protein